MENINPGRNAIKNWTADERPREKLISNGVKVLSNAELLAILINNGHRNKSAVEISKEILRSAKNNLQELGKISLGELKQIKGIGIAKAVTILAALELGRRRHQSALPEKISIKSSKDIAYYLKDKLSDLRHEVFAVIFLNRANNIKHFEIISSGGITGTVADPRMILRKAIEEDATSIILSHNHPSGNLKPSRADEELTLKIKQAATYFDIMILDHIIVSEEGYFSFSDEGIL